jgi:hypothetical protein
MPRSKHYKGHGDEVYRSMRKTYGDEDTAKRVFYATENKRKSKSERKRGRKR